MSKLSRHAYVTLITEDLHLLYTHMPPSLERGHISAIVCDSVSLYYPEDPRRVSVRYTGSVVEIRDEVPERRIPPEQRATGDTVSQNTP